MTDPCPLTPRKRTLPGAIGMSALSGHASDIPRCPLLTVADLRPKKSLQRSVNLGGHSARRKFLL